MATAEKLKEIAGRQRALLMELEQETKRLEELDLEKEKNRLQDELKRVTAEFEAAKQKLFTTSDENAGLKNRLYEQVYSEKASLLRNAAQKLEIYFQSSIAGEQNELAKLEAATRARIADCKKLLQSERLEAQDEINRKLEEVSALLGERLAEVRLQQPSGAFSDTGREEFARLKEACVTDEQMKQLSKKNNLESLVGLNLLNKLGLLIILIGVITASRYTYLRLPDMLKGIMMFLFGGAMLVAGEFLNRKKANVFSLGLTAGGVAALYIALSISYFGLQIVTMYPALILCVLITATAFLLSTRYKSQTILSFALLGGYLPIFSIGGDTVVLYAAIVYFVTLNLLALSVSFGRKWTAASFIGLFLNMGGIACVCFNFYLRSAALSKTLSIGYVIFAFVIYTLIPIIGTYREKVRFKTSDVVLIAVNTLFSSVAMYALFYAFRLGSFDGGLTIFFAAFYLLLGRLLESKFAAEKKMTGLFYLTGFAFVVLTVPLQLGVSWLSMGWLVEGTALLVYGILYKEKLFCNAGLIISALCLWSFLLFDLLLPGDTLFAYKYFAITLGSVAILVALVYKGELRTRPQRMFAYIALVNIWLYSQYLVYSSVWRLLYPLLGTSRFDVSYLCDALAIVATLLYAYLLPRVKRITGAAVKLISLVLYIFGILRLLLLHGSTSPYIGGITQSMGTTVVGTLILLGISLLSLLALNDVVRYFVLDRAMSVAFYPLILSGYFVVLLTQTLVCQYQLSFSSAAISIIYVVTALLWIVLGFLRRYSFLRRFGLGLAILSVVKLFLVDLYTLTQGYKIVSYFVLGVTLLAISFVYQYFNRRLESKGEAVQDAQENL